MGVSQIRGFEPGDADWGVRLEDVRGQAEAKEEVRRVVNLWQSGEAFELAGGRRERGLLFLGAPGTGKTMLAKAIATGFNSPIVMDGIDNPPFMRRTLTNRLNTLLDALYIVPRRVGRRSLRLPHSRPTGNQIYFIGATNVPMEALDPALTRPGRMGRHVWFRTPTKVDRLDIFDLYLTKVAHDEDLDTEKRRDELARVTNGYSPAMIEQVCSMALTLAHHDRRLAFGWADIVEAMTTVES